MAILNSQWVERFVVRLAFVLIVDALATGECRSSPSPHEQEFVGVQQGAAESGQSVFAQ